MKKSFFLVVFCFILIVPSFSYAEPFSVRPGIYFKYVADRNPTIQEFIGNTTFINYYGKYAEFYWEVLDVKNGTAKVLLTLNVSNVTTTTTRYMTEMEARRKFEKLISPFLSLNPDSVRGNCAIYSTGTCQVHICNDTVLGFIKFCDKTMYYLTTVSEKRVAYEYINVTIPYLYKSAIVTVNLENNTIEYNGSNIGPNLLFINPGTISAGMELLENSNEGRVFISNITTANFIVHTYYMDFKPPIIEIGTNTYEYFWYDSGTGILISGGIPPNIVKKVFGFDALRFSNLMELKNLEKGFNSKDYYGIGMTLKDTDFNFSATLRLSGVGISKIYLGLFVSSLTILLLSILSKFRRS